MCTCTCTNNCTYSSMYFIPLSGIIIVLLLLLLLIVHVHKVTKTLSNPTTLHVQAYSIITVGILSDYSKWQVTNTV